MPSSTMPSAIQEVIDAGFSVHRLCLEAIGRAHQGAWSMDPAQWSALSDTADIAQTLAEFALRQSPRFRHIAEAGCAVARASVDAIAPIEHIDDQLRATYAACLHLIDACDAALDGQEAAEEDARDEVVAESFPASDPPPPPTEI